MIFQQTHRNNDEVRRKRQRVNHQLKWELIWEHPGFPRGFEKTYKVHLVKLSQPTFLKSSDVELTDTKNINVMKKRWKKWQVV